jgi:stage IV sporulation protein FA
MDMFGGANRVKERRRERLERIRTQSRDSFSPYVDDWKDPIDVQSDPYDFPLRENDEENKPPSHEKWGLQVFASILLLGTAYLLFQTSLIPANWKDSAREVMTRDFNFTGVADWYEARFGPIPTLLPAMQGPSAVPATSTAKDVAVWRLPASWKIVKPFELQNAKVVLDTGLGEQVKIGEAGWVTYVGEQSGFGTTVIVRLTKGREVWLGNLDSVGVTKDEVLSPGQVIGTARVVNGKERHLYFAARAEEEFVDPLEVIPFE